MTNEELAAIEAAVASGNAGFAARLDSFEEEAAERFGKLEEALREVMSNSSVMLDAMHGLQVEVAGLSNRVGTLTRDITTGRTRDIDRLFDIERRLSELESQIKGMTGDGH